MMVSVGKSTNGTDNGTDNGNSFPVTEDCMHGGIVAISMLGATGKPSL